MTKAELREKIRALAFTVVGEKSKADDAAIAYDDIITNLNYDLLLNMYKVNVFTPMMITKYAIRSFLLHRILVLAIRFTF